MKLYIENWSGGKLVSQAWVQSIIDRYTFGGPPRPAFVVSPSEWNLYPRFTQILPSSVVPEQIHILKLRPQSLSDIEPFTDWLDANGCMLDRERRVDPTRIGLHSDFYGFHLRELVTGDLEVPLLAENVAAYKSTSVVRNELREGRMNRVSRERES